MRRLAVLLLILLSGCTTLELQDERQVFLPLIVRPRIRKGVGLFAGGCDVLEKLNVDWYYTGPQECEGHERVEYISHPEAVGREPTPHTLVYNEPEHQLVSMERMVTLFVPYANKHPDVVWVGPCPAYDLGLIPAFWTEFEEQAGYAMPSEKIRICLHCYYGAQECLRQVEAAARVGDLMDIPHPSVWLTEFGQVLGLDLTIRQQVNEMRQLAEALKTDTRVERYAYWPGLLRPGYEVRNGALSAWQPLAYDFYGYDLKTIVGSKLTDVGSMYAELPR